MSDQPQSLAVRTLVITAVVTGILLCLFLLGYAANVFLVFFLCVLFAVFLRGISHWICQHSSLSETWSLVVVVVLLGILIGVGGWLLAPKVQEQISAMASQLTNSAQHIEKQIQQSEWGRRVSASGLGFRELFSRFPNSLSGAGLVVSSTLGLIVYLFIVLFVGIYLAASPHLYINGFLKLLPSNKRARVREVLLAVGYTLQRFLIGRLILMVTNGILTAIGLMILGVPLAVPLGIVAGLLNFIPNIGPIIAAVPAILIAFVQSPNLALYVLIFYTAYQMLDGYVFTPLVQKQTISMPPALTIMVQVLFGVLLGSLGVLVAVPLLAVAMVTTKMLYVEDVLEAENKTDV